MTADDTLMNEETHLLEAQPERKRTPLPWSQLYIVLILQLPEPLTSQVIFPFAPQVCSSATFACLAPELCVQLMRDIGVTHGDERQVGYYVGFMVGVLNEMIT